MGHGIHVEHSSWTRGRVVLWNIAGCMLCAACPISKTQASIPQSVVRAEDTRAAGAQVPLASSLDHVVQRARDLLAAPRPPCPHIDGALIDFHQNQTIFVESSKNFLKIDGKSANQYPSICSKRTNFSESVSPRSQKFPRERSQRNALPPARTRHTVQ